MEDKRIKELREAFKTGKILTGEVITKKQINGQAYAVINYKGIEVYCAENELGLKDNIQDKINALLGVPIDFVVITVENGQFIVSRKIAMQQKQKKWEKIKQGDILTGRITGITAKNAFVEVLGCEFPLQIEDMIWNYTNDLRRHFKLGQRVKVKIVSIDPKKVSVKLATPDPWATPPKVLPQQVLATKVSAIAPFGIFVSLPDGKQCLCPPFSNARQHPIIDSIVAVLIKSVDVQNRKIYGTILRILR